MKRHDYLSHDWYSESLPGNISIGPRSWLYSSFAFTHYRSVQPVGVRIGHDSGLYNGTFFDLGPTGHVEIGSFTACVGVIFATNGKVSIGDYCFFAHEVVIADEAAAQPGGASRPDFAEDGDASIVIGNNVWVGAGAVLLSGTRLGEGSIVGAAAVVDFEVPPYSVVAGNPACIVKRIR